MICGQGVAPQAATIDAFRDARPRPRPGTGLLAAVVPGAFDAWLLMLRDHGTLPLREVLAPAIGYAGQGYPLVPAISAAIERVRELFTAEWPTSAAVYLPGGEVPAPGTLFRNRAPRRHLRPHPRARPRRRRRARAPDRGGARGLVPRLRRRGDRPLLPRAGAARHLRPPPRRPAARRRPGGLAGDASRSRCATTTTATRCARPGPGARRRSRCSSWRCSRASISPSLSADEPGVRPHRDRMRQARLRRSRGLLRRSRFRRRADGDAARRRATTTSAASWSASAPRSSCARGGSRAMAARSRCALIPSADDIAHGGAPGQLRRDRRADRGAGRGGGARRTRRHLPSRRHRPPRQHGLGDAVGRLAAELAGDPGARLLPRHPRPDVLARGGPSRPASRRASGRAPRSRPRSRCATASPTWRSARRAATSRTSGRCTSSCATSTSA